MPFGMYRHRFHPPPFVQAVETVVTLRLQVCSGVCVPILSTTADSVRIRLLKLPNLGDIVILAALCALLKPTNECW